MVSRRCMSWQATFLDARWLGRLRDPGRGRVDRACVPLAALWAPGTVSTRSKVDTRVVIAKARQKTSRSVLPRDIDHVFAEAAVPARSVEPDAVEPDGVRISRLIEGAIRIRCSGRGSSSSSGLLLREAGSESYGDRRVWMQDD